MTYPHHTCPCPPGVEIDGLYDGGMAARRVRKREALRESIGGFHEEGTAEPSDGSGADRPVRTRDAKEDDIW
jgi:hypothetical protein